MASIEPWSTPKIEIHNFSLRRTPSIVLTAMYIEVKLIMAKLVHASSANLILFLS